MDRAINRQTVAALESTDCTPGPPAHDAIDGAGVIPSAGEPALYLDNHRAIHAIAALIPTVSVWVVIGVRVIERKERKTEAIEENELVETAEATKPIIPVEVAVVEATKPVISIEVAVVEATKPIIPIEVTVVETVEPRCGV